MSQIDQLFAVIPLRTKFWISAMSLIVLATFATTLRATPIAQGCAPGGICVSVGRCDQCCTGTCNACCVDIHGELCSYPGLDFDF